jgi:hypothetical protein
MFCTNCGQKVYLEDKFRSACGTPVRGASDAAAAAPPAPAVTGAPVVVTSSTAELHRPLAAAAAPAGEIVRPPTPSAPLSEPIEPPRETVLPVEPERQQCLQCGNLQPVHNDFCDSCGAALNASVTPVVEAPPQRFIPTAFDLLPVIEPEEPKPRRRKTKLPVLEILVAVLLLFGAGFAVWMLRSSLPGKTLAPASNVEVTISPENAQVKAGNGFDFAATVSGTDDAEVTWTVQEGEDGGRVVPRGAKASNGGISQLAVYVAPKVPGTYHLVATSKADTRKSASAEITVSGR